MGYQGKTATLTADQATQLLGCVGDVEVLDVRQAAFTNDVFRTTTRSHGVFFIKFHTARWYVDLEDTAPVVDRELAAYELLSKRGISLPYMMWGDCLQAIVPQSVLISSELHGRPAPIIMREAREAADEIAKAFGQFLASLHAIEFTNRSPLARIHALLAPSTGRIPYISPYRHTPWDPANESRSEIAQRDAMTELETAKQFGIVTPIGYDALAEAFADMADIIEPAYESPRFILQNCHAHHFHTEKTNGHWSITGVYDFESVAADDPTMDLLEIEVGLTRETRSFDWRPAFHEGYGPWPSFRRFQLRLLSQLVYYANSLVRDKRFAEIIPDLPWLTERWQKLTEADSWDALWWYPTT